MSTKQPKIYVGKGVRKSETWIKATINPDKILEHVEEYKGSKYVRINININQKPDKYGKDVEITVDTWKPKQDVPVNDEVPTINLDDDIKDVPF